MTIETVNKAKQSGADFVVASVNPQLLEQFLITSKQLGAKYKITAPNSALGQDSIDKLGDTAEGVLLAGPVPVHTATGFKSIDQFNKELDEREARGDKNAVADKRDITIEGWLAAHAFATVASTIQGTVTREALTKELQTAKNVDIGDITPPWNPSAVGTPLPRVTNPYGYYLIVKDGHQQLLQNEAVKMF